MVHAKRFQLHTGFASKEVLRHLCCTQEVHECLHICLLASRAGSVLGALQHGQQWQYVLGPHKRCKRHEVNDDRPHANLDPLLCITDREHAYAKS